MKRNILGMITTALIAGAVSASAAVVFEDNFDSGKGAWASRLGLKNDISAVTFTGSQVQIRNSGQPTAIYHDFPETVLADGQTLRITVDVATDTPTGQKGPLRMGIGFASSAIAGDEVAYSVPLSGYWMTIPAAGQPFNPQVTWVSPERGGGKINFFNSITTFIGNPKPDNAVSASSTSKKWVIEVKRSGSELIFSGSLDGTAFGTAVTASGTSVIPEFKFNTLALAHFSAAGATATFDNLKVEVITEPAPIVLTVG